MKALKNITTSLIITAIAASPAFAAQEASNSGLLTWLFLGFIGLIVRRPTHPGTGHGLWHR